jgi:hypothetical protein
MWSVHAWCNGGNMLVRMWNKPKFSNKKQPRSKKLRKNNEKKY